MTTPFETHSRVANTVYAGPESGDKDSGSFRKLVLADLPTIPLPNYFSCNIMDLGKQMTNIIPKQNGGDGRATSFFTWHETTRTYDGGIGEGEANNTAGMSFEGMPNTGEGIKFTPKIKGIYSVGAIIYHLTTISNADLVNNTDPFVTDEFVVIGKNIGVNNYNLNDNDNDVIALLYPTNPTGTGNFGDEGRVSGSGTVFMNGTTDFISFMFKTNRADYNYGKLINPQNKAYIRLLTRC